PARAPPCRWRSTPCGRARTGSSGSSRLHFLRGTKHRAHDPVVRAAAAQVRVKGFWHWWFLRVLGVGMEGCGVHRDAADAIAALRGLLGEQRFLHRMELAALRQPFHRSDLLSGDRPERRIARGYRLAFDDHEARAALAVAAAEAAADEAEVVAQHVEERRVRPGRHAATLSVDFQFRHASTMWISASRSCACRSPRSRAAATSRGEVTFSP